MAVPGIKRQTLIIAVFISFGCGFLAGAGFAVYKTTGPAAAITQTGSDGAGGGISGEQAAAIAVLEKQTAAAPGDFQLWIQLGNAYYDTNQPEKAIRAYTRSLDLHTGDANLLTDLGMMYRGAGQPEKAIEYFDRAIALEPHHQPARLNKGVVLLEELHSPDRAIATWEELLRIDPEAKAANGDFVRDYIQEAKRQQGGRR